jgi:hypothetical protein
MLHEEAYEFATYDDEKPNKSTKVQVADYEGVWTFVYFAYAEKKAVGYLKLGGLPVKRIQIDAVHKTAYNLQFIFGGK